MNSSQNNSAECREVAGLLVFYVCEEVSEAERKRIEVHLRNCEECLQQLAEEETLAEAVSAMPQSADEIDSTGILLAQCRSELAESLDDLAVKAERPRWEPLGWLRRWPSQSLYRGVCMALRE